MLRMPLLSTTHFAHGLTELASTAQGDFPYWAPCIVPKGAAAVPDAEGEIDQQFYLAVNPVSGLVTYTDGSNIGTNITRVINCFLMGFKAHSKRRNIWLVL